MGEIKAIETVYNGYRFRSRLEARWAVFFDACLIKYHYEPEGFRLYDGTFYLPDFYLDDFNIYVEIKPLNRDVVTHVGDGNQWEQKCRNFRDSTGCAILLCYGDPAEDIYKYLFAYDLDDDSAGSSEWYCNFYELDGKIVLITEPSRPDRSIRVTETFKENDNIGTWNEFKDEGFYHSFYDCESRDFLNTAKTMARQARFEHGGTIKF